MTIDILLPAITGLQVTGVDHQDKHITLSLTSTHPTAHCPVCGNSSEKIHSRYQRRVFDLPWSDKQVHLLLTVRRFFCLVEDCQRKVFAERLHPAIKAWARRTSRLDHHLEALALKAGGEGGALLCHLLNICRVSADTLLNLSRKTPIVSYESIPKIVGIDEWAIRKGQTYATIVVDLETRRPIELLANAEVKTVETWFREHPDINIVSRDRDTMFAEAARRGASQARQVADRWHLLKNLGDAVKRMLEAHSAGLKETATAMLDEPVLQQKDSVRTASPVGGTHASEPEPATKSAVSIRK